MHNCEITNHLHHLRHQASRRRYLLMYLNRHQLIMLAPVSFKNIVATIKSLHNGSFHDHLKTLREKSHPIYQWCFPQIVFIIIFGVSIIYYIDSSHTFFHIKIYHAYLICLPNSLFHPLRINHTCFRMIGCRL